MIVDLGNPRTGIKHEASAEISLLPMSTIILSDLRYFLYFTEKKMFCFVSVHVNKFFAISADLIFADISLCCRLGQQLHQG